MEEEFVEPSRAGSALRPATAAAGRGAGEPVGRGEFPCGSPRRTGRPGPLDAVGRFARRGRAGAGGADVAQLADAGGEAVEGVEGEGRVLVAVGPGLPLPVGKLRVVAAGELEEAPFEPGEVAGALPEAGVGVGLAGVAGCGIPPGGGLGRGEAAEQREAVVGRDHGHPEQGVQLAPGHGRRLAGRAVDRRAEVGGQLLRGGLDLLDERREAPEAVVGLVPLAGRGVDEPRTARRRRSRGLRRPRPCRRAGAPATRRNRGVGPGAARRGIRRGRTGRPARSPGRTTTRRGRARGRPDGRRRARRRRGGPGPADAGCRPRRPGRGPCRRSSGRRPPVRPSTGRPPPGAGARVARASRLRSPPPWRRTGRTRATIDPPGRSAARLRWDRRSTVRATPTAMATARPRP